MESAVLDGAQIESTCDGTNTVSPASTTTYTVEVIGSGGSSTCSATVKVTARLHMSVRPTPPAEKVIDRLTIHVNFDFDESNIREADKAELQKAINFVRKYSGAKDKTGRTY